jgi:hypothetical protein
VNNLKLVIPDWGAGARGRVCSITVGEDIRPGVDAKVDENQEKAWKTTKT